MGGMGAKMQATGYHGVNFSSPAGDSFGGKAFEVGSVCKIAKAECVGMGMAMGQSDGINFEAKQGEGDLVSKSMYPRLGGSAMITGIVKGVGKAFL